MSGCVGPVYIAYTWQVRDPYPQGGDLEITQMLQGGRQDEIAMGSMGAGNMSECDEHTFKNNGLGPIIVEVRYGTYVDPAQAATATYPDAAQAPDATNAP